MPHRSRSTFARRLVLLLALMLWAPSAGAQTSADAGEAQESLVDRTFTAVNYQYRSGSTRIDFRGSALAPTASGEAEVESRRGFLEIDAEFRGLRPARTLGSEYFTYVLWAVTPQGRAQNLGELVLRGDRSSLRVTTELQAFALIVTAEPYFAITQPTDVVILENAVRADTRGRIEEVPATSALVRRAAFGSEEKPDELTAKLMVVSSRVPLELYQARNAVRLIRRMGAEAHAKETFDKAVDLLLQAENYQARSRPETRAATMMARQAVQVAEDARLLTMQRLDEERQALERREAAEREAQARKQAELEAQRRAQADIDRQAAEEARRTAERARTDAEAAQSRADAARLEAERARTDAEAAAERAQAVRLEAERAAEAAAREKADADAARQAALAELERIREESAAERAKLDAARAEALRQQQAAEVDAARAREAAATADQLREEAERERAELRDRLQAQLNQVLETTSTARGLIVSMSDVLFDTGQFTLRPTAREKLARISGILAIQPDLRIEVEGHTDSVGTTEFNQRLSEQRATAVRDYLVEQGIGAEFISARGFGEERPKVNNDTAAGRQQNRRVELVVSGKAIGSEPTR